MPTPARPIFAIFEGGGAKGVAHIGALEAIERHKMEIIGAAGASAGALVATFASVGLSAKDIMDPASKRRNLLAQRGMTPVDVLGAAHWRQFGFLQRGIRRVGWAMFAAGFSASLMWAPKVSQVLWRLQARRGHFSTTAVETLVNDVLRERLKAVYVAAGRSEDPPEWVTFRDLDYETFPALRPLKIVATDITHGCLKVFDRAETPGVVVAEAVAASIAIPLVFQPVHIKSYEDGNTRFVDGGLVSNLPVWVFAEEKLAFERRNPRQPAVPIIGFTLDPKEPSAQSVIRRRARRKNRKSAKKVKISAFEHHLMAVARTSLNGSQSLSQRFVDDLVVARLQTSLGLLDFDAMWEDLRDAYRDGFDCANATLRHALIAKPDRVRAELKRIESLVRRRINARRRREGQPKVKPLRANLIEKVGEQTFRVTYAYNMDADPDDRMPLDARGRGAPHAYRTKTLVFAKIGPSATVRGRDYMTKYERALLRPGVHSLICTPVFGSEAAWRVGAKNRPRPVGVFCLDSDSDLSADFNDPHIRRLLATESTLLFPALAPE